MYRKILLLLATSIFIFPANSTLAAEPKAAFIRNDGLWMKMSEHEHRIDRQNGLTRPQWSYDGSMISYSDSSGRLWVYNTLTTRTQLVYHSPVTLPQWSPVENTIAFRAYSLLNIRDMNNPLSSFQNVADGADNYSWKPDGSGFIVSASASLTPAGWTQISLYSVPKNANGQHVKARLLRILPSESDDFFAIGTSKFLFSNNGRMMAFIACPTASYSADTNFLSVLSSEGKTLKIAGKMLANTDWVKWSPSDDNLAFIEGERRLTSENKRLTLYDAGSNSIKVYTPIRMADNGFTWSTPDSIIVSRAPETGWNEKQKTSHLVLINLKTNKQTAMTSPDSHFSAHSPVTLADGRTTWERSGNDHDVMLAAAGEQQIVWIKNITSSQWTIYGAR